MFKCTGTTWVKRLSQKPLNICPPAEGSKGEEFSIEYQNNVHCKTHLTKIFVTSSIRIYDERMSCKLIHKINLE